MIIPRRPHAQDEFTLEMRVDVEGLRMDIILSQPASSQVVRSIAATRRGRYGVSNPERRHGRPRSVQGRRNPEYRDPFKTSTDEFLNPNFTRTAQECVLLHQPDVGVDDDEKETTATSQRAAVREEFASPTEKRQQQGTTAWATKQNKQFDLGRSY